MQANASRITVQSVFITAMVFLALMAWTARPSEGESDLVTALKFAQIAIYGALAVGTIWFGLRAVRRSESPPRVSTRAIVVTVAIMLVIGAAGLTAALTLA